MSEFRTERAYDQLFIYADGALLAGYRFLGARRPYFWPLNVPAGSVVRGAGTGDHPHHMGLYLSYGFHGQNGATNIWSDWDEPPYGPCGAGHHVEFMEVNSNGFSERIVYADAAGGPICEEERHIRFARAREDVWSIDWESSIVSVVEPMRVPFHFSARPATDILKTVELRTSERAGDEAKSIHRGDWMSVIGELNGERAGFVVYDDPRNPDEQAELRFANVLMMGHDAPAPFPSEGVTLRCRAVFFQGDETAESLAR